MGRSKEGEIRQNILQLYLNHIYYIKAIFYFFKWKLIENKYIYDYLENKIYKIWLIYNQYMNYFL